MRKQLILGIMLGAIGITALPLTASAHDSWHGEDDRDEGREHHWHDHDEEDDLQYNDWNQTRYIVSEPVYAQQGYYYQPEPVYYVPPPPPRIVYYEQQPVFSFFFGR